MNSFTKPSFVSDETAIFRDEMIVCSHTFYRMTQEFFKNLSIIPFSEGPSTDRITVFTDMDNVIISIPPIWYMAQPKVPSHEPWDANVIGEMLSKAKRYISMDE